MRTTKRTDEATPAGRLAEPIGTRRRGRRRREGLRGASRAAIALVLVVALAVAGGASYYVLVYRAPSKGSSSGVNQSLEMGGFYNGQVVTFLYNGTSTYECVPSATTLFPGDANATSAASKTTCEVGAANQTAVGGQVPQWILVPAFAGLSIFGVSALGASPRGFPEWNNTTLPTQCGAGGTPTACVDHPTYLYSPDFTKVERYLNLTSGTSGLTPGLLPTPAHDHLISDEVGHANVYWGITVVLVFDPDIFPAQNTATCTAIAPSNLTQATGNCLTSYSALKAASTTCSRASAGFNTAGHGNPIYEALVGSASCAPQVVIPGGIDQLNGNLYIPFAVLDGPPPSFPM